MMEKGRIMLKDDPKKLKMLERDIQECRVTIINDKLH